MLFDTVIDFYAIPGIHEKEVFYILKEYSPQNMEGINQLLSQVKHCEKLPEKDNVTCLKQGLEQLDKTYQQYFLKPQYIERHMLEDTSLHLKQKLVPILNPAFGESINLNANPDKIILYGASENALTTRINSLQQILAKKSELEKSQVQVFVLVGDRDLWPLDEKATEVLLIEKLTQTGRYTTRHAKEIISSEFIDFFGHQSVQLGSTRYLKAEEIINARNEIIKHFKKTYHVSWPSETDLAKKIIREKGLTNSFKIYFVNAPKKINGERPDTYSTLEAWWQEYGSRLQQETIGKLEIYTISNQPHALYQLEQAKLFAFNQGLSNLEFKVIAEGVDLMQYKYCSTALNNLARIIYYGKEMVIFKVRGNAEQ